LARDISTRIEDVCENLVHLVSKGDAVALVLDHASFVPIH